MHARLLGALCALMVVMALSWTGGQAIAQSGGEGESDLASGETPFRPVAIVNESVITGFDLVQRMQILAALGFPAASADALRTEALNRLIDDRLKMQEAKRYGIEPSREQIAEGIGRLAKQANMEADVFVASLAQRGISRQALEDMIAAEIAWRNLVRKRFVGRIEPGEAEIDAEISLLGERAGVSYRLADIGLPVAPDGSDREKVRALAEKIYRELLAGGDFQAAVRRYSRSPSAARGGELGWIAVQQLPPEVAEALAGLEPGDVTPPIEVTGGFSILKLLDRRVEESAAVDASDPELRERVRRQLMNREVARLAEGRLQELRRDAVVELR